MLYLTVSSAVADNDWMDNDWTDNDWTDSRR